MANQINCPNCGTEISVEEVLSNRLRDEIKIEYSKKIERNNRELEDKLKQIESEKLKIESEKKLMAETIENQLNQKLKIEKSQIEDKLRKKFIEENQDKLNYLQKEIEEKNAEIAKKKELEIQLMQAKKDNENLKDNIETELREKLNIEKAELESKLRKKFNDENQDKINYLQKELDEQTQIAKEKRALELELMKTKEESKQVKEKIELELRKQYSDDISKEREKIQIEIQEKEFMRIKEKENIIEQLKKQLNEAQRKAEQGSMQLQGEVQELAIEEFLKANFPFDSISEIKKGERGADVLQTVKNYDQECGKIYYESKRTKKFNKEWLAKFKEDMIAKGADAGILVTEAMPDDRTNAYLSEEGIWVCTFNDFKTVSQVIRNSILNISKAIETGKNVESKMGMLYQYLTSNDFKMHIEEIVGGFQELNDQIMRERTAMEKQWTAREKQLKRVLLNTTRLYGSISGIAGNELPEVELLKLPGEAL